MSTPGVHNPRGIARPYADGDMVRGEASPPRGNPRGVLAGGGRSPLVELFPEARTADAYFVEAPIQSGFTVNSGDSAWFGLQRLEVDTDTGQEVALTQLRATLMATDPNADGGPSNAGTPVGWGSVYGHQAAIVVGFNLPIVKDQWTSAPAAIAGVEDDGLGELAEEGLSRYIWWSKFPPGVIEATNKVELTDNKSWVPTQFRCPLGARLDVALVCRGADISGQGGKSVCGFAHLQLTLANTIIETEFTGN